jgi:hypothetical protein
MPTLSGYKSIFSSKTFWGALLSLLAMFIPKLQGIQLDSIWPYVTAGIGFILTIVGRLTAKKQVTLTGTPPAADISTR